MSIHVRLGARDEEGPGLVQHIQAGKVDVGAIHDVDGSGFRYEHIEGTSPRKNSEKCYIQFKSTPRIFPSNHTEILTLKAGTVQLTGQQWIRSI